MAANCGPSNEYTPPSFSVEVKRYGINHETDLPTEPPQASQQARLPRADGHQERTPRAGAPSPERSQESDRQRYEEPQVRDLSTTPNPDDGRVRRFTFPRAHRLKRRRLIRDRKSTRLNSSHVSSSYAVFCSKTKHKTQ